MQKRDKFHIVCANALDANDLKKAVRDEKKTRTIRKLISECVKAGLPMPEQEARDLIPGRKFRVDLFWRDAGLAVEYEGGTYQHLRASGDDGRLAQSRHLNPVGFREDCIKYNLLAMLGITVLRFDAVLVNDGTAFTMIGAAYHQLAGANAMIENAFQRADQEIAHSNITAIRLRETW